jgi:hypothetical protein
MGRTPVDTFTVTRDDVGSLVPFWFQQRPTENNADGRNSRLLRLIPGGYVVLRTIGGRLGLLTNQLLCH